MMMPNKRRRRVYFSGDHRNARKQQASERGDDIEQISSNKNLNENFFPNIQERQQQEFSMKCVYRHKSIKFKTATQTQHGSLDSSQVTGCRVFSSTKKNTIPSIHDNRYQISQRPTTLAFSCVVLILATLIGAISCIVVYQVKSLSTNSGRTDYAIAGESVELTCHYTMKDDAEDIKQVTWSKDGKNFLRWKKNKLGLDVLSYTFKGHIEQNSVYDRLIIHNVTIAMHGKYACSIRTDLGTHSGEHNLVVFSGQQCKLNDWRIHSEPVKCRETFRFDCRHMFPRPVPSCGLWNSKSNKFIRSVVVDISEETIGQQYSTISSNTANKYNYNETSPASSSSVRETYRIRYSDKYALKFPNGSTNLQLIDLLQYAGHLELKCDIIVPETSWNVSMNHKLFDYQDGCNQDPLNAIEQMRTNFSHYAAQRMQQAGLTWKQHEQDDIKMLTTSLRYEIIPPSHFISVDRNTLNEKPPPVGLNNNFNNSGNLTNVKALNTTEQPKVDNNLDLNCWQRPRIGSFARLFCVDQSRKNQIKLIGANLLECRPNGWMPIKSSVSSLGEPSVVRRQQLMDRKLSAMPVPGRRPTRAGRPEGLIAAQQSVQAAGINPNKVKVSSETDDEDDHDDDDNDDSARIDLEAAPKSPHLSNEVEGPTRSPGPAQQASEILEEKIRFENEIRANEYEHQLTQAELASLLPACVSVSPAKPRKQTNRLPMIEASSVRNSNGQIQPKNGRNDHDDNHWNWYIFSSSKSIHHQASNQQYIITTFVATCATFWLIVANHYSVFMHL